MENKPGGPTNKPTNESPRPAERASGKISRREALGRMFGVAAAPAIALAALSMYEGVAHAQTSEIKPNYLEGKEREQKLVDLDNFVRTRVNKDAYNKLVELGLYKKTDVEVEEANIQNGKQTYYYEVSGVERRLFATFDEGLDIKQKSFSIFTSIVGNPDRLADSVKPLLPLGTEDVEFEEVLENKMLKADIDKNVPTTERHPDRNDYYVVSNYVTILSDGSATFFEEKGLNTQNNQVI